MFTVITVITVITQDFYHAAALTLAGIQVNGLRIPRTGFLQGPVQGQLYQEVMLTSREHVETRADI